MAEAEITVARTEARDEAERIAAASPWPGRLGPNREEAAAILAQRGVHPRANGGSTHAAPTYAADAYAGVNLNGAPVPEGVDPAVVVEGGKAIGLALQLDPILAGVVARELAEKPDPAAV